MQEKWFQYFLFPVLSLLLLCSCEGNDPSANAGRLWVKLTDATDVTIKELYLDIKEIAVYATDTTSTEGEWIALEYSGGEYNLLKLFNGQNVRLVDQYFPAGKAIRKVRLVPGNNNRFLTHTVNTYPLQLPPEIINGVDIDIIEPIVLMPNIISSLIIDVNAALSVRELDGNYFLYPAARAFAETYGASLRGYVNPPEDVAFVAIIHEPDTLMTLLEPDGMFLFPGLRKGTWEVYLVANPNSIYGDTTIVWNIDTTGVVAITPRPIQLPTRPTAQE